eukprot:CAMPEP_0206146614 /NCGR_PEP_ID=MMETSP1473-20131121/30905_1 /ASSEMBLY_ACC=CAM_ASM_001109 /TAXON_ID=1461547 /ORGANISM="Stichococcus sp, Strain RCC1054" /LENGTH=84 /DNA_ID=CAMNT_0053543233 /DNA_START=36 /DNA_END=286 /DNA_ORIENTATION=+
MTRNVRNEQMTFTKGNKHMQGRQTHARAKKNIISNCIRKANETCKPDGALGYVERVGGGTCPSDAQVQRCSCIEPINMTTILVS